MDIKALETPPDRTRFCRLCVGVHHIVFSLRGDTIYVHRVFHRQDGYGRLERA